MSHSRQPKETPPPVAMSGPPLRVPPTARILIVKLSAIGDCVMASPVAGALRAALPEAFLAWAVSSRCREIIEGNPFLDEVLLLDVAKPAVRAYAELIRRVRSRNFDIVLDLQGIFKSSIVTALSGAPVRIASDNFRRVAQLAATHVASVSHLDSAHPTHQYLARAGAVASTPGEYWPRVPFSADDTKAVAELLATIFGDADKPLVALNPGCTSPIRRWETNKFAAVGDGAAAKDCNVVIVGGPQDDDLCGQVERSMQASAGMVAGKLTLKQLAALFSRCAVVVTGDTGPLHIAYAVQAPVIALFGPIPAAQRLLDGAAGVGLEHNEGCRPPAAPHCFRTGRCTCLEAIQPEEVLDHLVRIVAAGGAT